jgi:hypothetical protein
VGIEGVAAELDMLGLVGTQRHQPILGHPVL